MNKIVSWLIFIFVLPLIYFILTFGFEVQSISTVARMPLDIFIFLFLAGACYIVWSGLVNKEFIAATFANIQIMILSEAKNPKLFWTFLITAMLFIFSTFAHLIYFDFVVVMAITFLGLLFLSLICGAVLRGKVV
ncbi:MAG: hypothetical protein WCI04_01135 [archaeon]